MAPFHPFEDHLEAAWPVATWQDVGVLVAVSGGADSVALLRAMHALKPCSPSRLAAAHFNHRLRGAESDADAEFVVELCRSLDVECFVGSNEEPDAARISDGVEAAARAARYEFLKTTAEQQGARYVATAHTIDDQAETILHHVLRGTGLAGLSGMHKVRTLGPAVTLMRPMLSISHAEVLEYLEALHQPFCDDISNRDLQFTRNWIRHELLPTVKRDYSPTVVESLARLGNLAAAAERVIQAVAEELFESCLVASTGESVSLDCRVLATQDRHLVRELFILVWRRREWPLRQMGYAQWDLLADMALSNVSRKATLPGGVAVERTSDTLTLSNPASQALA